MIKTIEIWKDIENYEGYYQVSNMGRIRSVRRILCDGKTREGTIIKAFPDAFGYIRVRLYMNGKSQRFMVHRLVATAFVDNPNGYPILNHKDENKSNNQATNLEWCTQKYNINYGTRTKRASGENTKNHKLRKSDVMYIRNNYKPKDREFGQIPLARKYGVSVTTIEKVIRKKNWKYVD